MTKTVIIFGAVAVGVAGAAASKFWMNRKRQRVTIPANEFVDVNAIEVEEEKPASDIPRLEDDDCC